MDALAYFNHLGNQSLPTQELPKTLYLHSNIHEPSPFFTIDNTRTIYKAWAKIQVIEDFLMMEVTLNLIYKRNKAIPKTACPSSFVCDSFGIESYSLSHFRVC